VSPPDAGEYRGQLGPISVAVVSPYDLGRRGGVQDQVLGLVSWLRDEGHDAWAVGPGDGPAGSISVGRAASVSINGSRAPVALGPGTVSRVRAAVAGADLIHVHEPFVPLASLAAGRARDAVLVGTFHADPSPAVRRVYRAGGWALRRLLVPYRALTAVSPVAAAAVARLRAVALVPNGLDLDAFDSAPKATHRAVFVGRDDPRKGLDVLLDAWRLVRREVPDAELVVISDRHGHDVAGVDFVGQVDDPTKRHLLAGAAVAVCPNLAGESFGMVVVEAMAAGCAVVASALPAFAHVLGEAGALAKPGDAEGLAATIVRVITDDDALSTLQQRARQRVEQFDRHSVVAGYLSAYQSALAR